MTVFVYYGDPEGIERYSSREAAEATITQELNSEEGKHEGIEGITVIEGVELETAVNFTLSSPGGET